MLFDSFLGLFSNDLAIDLGTASTLVFVKGRGIVSNEPSVVAIRRDDRGTKKILAVGNEAKKMLGRTPANIVAIRPMRDGVIADFEVTESMLSYFIKKVHNRRSFIRPRIIISVPSGITPVEKRAVKESAESAGAREIYLIEEPMAAAIGERTAELIKTTIGIAYPEKEVRSVDVKGRDLVTGVPKTLEITSEEVRGAISGPVNTIVESVKTTLERTPPELAADIVDQGIVLAGGGALLRNLDVLLREETGLPIVVAESPLTAVVVGSGMALDELSLLKEIAIDF
jgi:rod shape-determining protein MreB